MESTHKIYTNNIISIATLIGGPIAAGFLIGHNYKVFGDRDKQKYSIIIGIVGSLIFFELLFLIPDKIMNSIPNAIIPSIYTAIIYYVVHRIQDDRIKEAIQNGINKASGWRAAGIGLLCSIFLLAYIFARAFVLPEFSTEVMTFGSAGHEIRFHKSISIDDVKTVGEELTKFGYFAASEKQAVELTNEDGTYSMRIYVPKDWWNNEDILESMRSLQDQISNALNRSDFKIKMFDGTYIRYEEKDIN